MIAVAYIAREPEAVEPFLKSWDSHPSGFDRTYRIAVCKGFRPVSWNLSHWADNLIRISDWGYSPRAYRAAAERTSAEFMCFLNSWCVIQQDNWLSIMSGAMKLPDVGIVGCTGSLESYYSNRPAWWRRLFFPPFPNPHVRTNAFMIRRELLLDVWPRFALCKKQEQWQESGWNGVTRRITALGYRALVVNAESRAYAWNQWQDSGTFRSGDQKSLLVGDNRTCQWERGMDRDWLSSKAWDNMVA